MMMYNKNDQTMTVNELTETLKHEFLNKYDFFTYNNDVWTMAKPIAEFLEYKKARKAVVYHVDINDKLMIQDFPNNIREEIQKCHISKVVNPFDPFTNSVKNIHPYALFISSAGVLTLFMKSSKPVARLMKKWLILDVLPTSHRNK